MIQYRINPGIAQSAHCRHEERQTHHPGKIDTAQEAATLRSAQCWRAARASSRLRVSPAPVVAWCNGKKLRWLEPITLTLEPRKMPQAQNSNTRNRLRYPWHQPCGTHFID